jgi:hypothetical protein
MVEKVFSSDSAVLNDFVDLLLFVDYLFMVAAMPIASNIT